MEKNIQFFQCDKDALWNGYSYCKRVLFTLTLPEVILEKMLRETKISNSLEDKRMIDSPLRHQSCLFMLEIQEINRIWEYLRILDEETVGKYYEDKDCHYKPEESMKRMYNAFEKYTGLDRNECTQDFRMSLVDFLNTDNGVMNSKIRDIEEHEDEFNGYIFMRILDT